MLDRWQTTIVDEKGNVRPGAVVQIRSETTGALAAVYKDPEGTQPWPTGFVTADENGYVHFHAHPDYYRITSINPAIDWRYVKIGVDTEQIAEAAAEAIEAATEQADRAEQEADRAEAAAELAMQSDKVIYKNSLAELDAIEPEDDGVPAVVWDDPDPENNGYYVWSLTDEAWAKSAIQPATKDDIEGVRDEFGAMIERGPATANLFDKTKAVSGYRVNGATGALYNGAAYSASDFIPVKPDTAYRLSNAGNWAAYDAQGQYLSGGSNQTGFTTPENAATVRFDCVTTVIDGVMLTEGAKFPSTYVPYQEGSIVKDIVLTKQDVQPTLFDAENKLISGLLIPQRSLPFLTRVSLNQYDSTDIGNLEGYYINNNNGNLVADANNSVSHWIPIDPSKTYSVYPEGNRLAFYDANRNFISGLPAGVLTWTPPEGAAWVRTSVRNVVRNTFTLVEGDTPPSLPDPYHRYEFDETILGVGGGSSARWLGKKVNIIGNSITEDTNSWWRKSFVRLGFAVARNYGVGGTAVGVRAAPWDDNAMCIRYAEMDDDADLIIVNMPETNDVGQVPLGTWSDTSNTTYYGAAKILAEGLVNKYPTKTIAWITLPPNYHMRDNPSPGYGTLWDYADASKRVCEYYAIPCLDILRMTQLRPYNPTNGEAYFRDSPPYFLHPNEAGHDMLSAIIEPWLLTL